MAIKTIAMIAIGFAGGLAVGTGFVAFLVVLGVIPRLTQLTKTEKWIHAYEWSAVSGAVVGGWISLRSSMLYAAKYWLVPIGLLSGIFIGMLAAALTEVLNVWPILAKRMRMANKIVLLMMAIVLGKVFGSLFYWIYFVEAGSP
ncbi:stage V sporulation protein AB [Anoxybacteroides tepidamans]|uniref:stage V sporulation protein AB n=1 Tax=Anoxybacteroides tepidamans TaxID=265948 RepID=UPI000483DC7E|nr:stage V sporulation protein AB [Anoxybacillus tepidamans]